MCTNISEVTAQKLRSQDYLEIFPEYYQLSSVIEIGLWHNHQSVLDHVLRVYENMESILEKLTPEATRYLSGQAGNKTKKELLQVATLLHDIAKKETLIITPTGANCPGHEHIAAGQVKNFQTRFDLDRAATRYVETIVLHHGFVSDIITQVIAKPQQEELFWNLYLSSVGEPWFELLILMLADLQGSDLNTSAPEEFSKNEQLLEDWISKQSDSLGQSSQ